MPRKSAQGARKCAIDVTRDGVISRGVLLDIPKIKKVEWMEPGERISPADLDAAEKDHRVVFTQLLTRDRLHEIDSLAACPAIFQEYVDKQVELRITIVGQEVFAAAIYSQEYPETCVDFRRFALLPPEKDVKPPETSTRPSSRRTAA